MVVQSAEGMASVESSIDVEEADAAAASPHSDEKKRRLSSRIQVKQKPQKAFLVRQRVELLDEHEHGPRKKPNVADSEELPKACDSVDKSDRVRAKEALRLFNKHYLYFVQEEEKRALKAEALKKASKAAKKKKGAKNSKGSPETKVAKRPDLKALTKASVHHYGSSLSFACLIVYMHDGKEILFPSKRFGSIPGIDVGHQFYSRAEMVAVGFHSHWLNGIDYMGQSYSKGKYSNYTMPLAVAIVISGMYEDDLDNAEEVVYTGQGGHNLTGDKRQCRDQVLQRGNLALKNCVEQNVPVRVVRGHDCKSSYCGKIYTYDGLYKVVNYWAEKGISGFTVFKYRLKRLEGYTYCKSIQVAQDVKLPNDASGCNCKGSCVDSKTCECAKLNGSDFPYVHRDGGRLIEAKDVVFECGPKCGCGPSCVNRTSQRGLKHRFEVFRTPMKGWAVRSWDFIPSGAPVCEYVGILRKTEDLDSASENYYIFDIDCLQTMKGLDGREVLSLQL
ncbi:hypothetical protein ACLB2K_061317 [Fragaria x ananassa]